MPSSGVSIDYLLRPAKAVERHILGDFISVAMKLRPKEKYRYFGLGSYGFRDFILYNQLFGFEQLTSAEIDTTLEKRCKFNRPAPNVKIKIASAGEALETIRWDLAPYIVWLDYDGRMKKYVYDDLATIATHAQHGTLVCITLNAHYTLPKFKKDIGPFMRDRRGELGRATVSRHELEPERFNRANAPVTIHRILLEHLENKISGNEHSSAESPMTVHETALFQYQDTSRMMTSVFMLCTGAERSNLKKILKASNVDRFCKDIPYRLEVPILTSRERRHLERNVGKLAIAARVIGVEEEHLRDFGSVSRYWPYFGEVDM